MYRATCEYQRAIDAELETRMNSCADTIHAESWATIIVRKLAIVVEIHGVKA